MTKAELRREMRTRLAALGPARAVQSRAIVAALARPLVQAGSGWIALFSPMPSEPDIELLWESAPGRFCYPRIAQSGMEFVEVEQLADLTVSAWHPHIREHRLAEARLVPPVDIGAILVPGLAFTKDGHRLGRGGGFYDRYLAALPATTHKIGVCFALQLVETLPIEPHDQRMDAVVTEEGLEE
ncbi:MAG: 5-formyltetrahydrofolate cyclo-ligase [Chthoniobacter sp.]|uniref:5-formyltetrahydrofolate cyclo-ligase n=1 Tax=Chthoniobacter sp. TaxID=2510640 RepID=UPI0032A1B143